MIVLMTAIVGIGYPYSATLLCLTIMIGRLSYVVLRKPELSIIKSYAYGAAIAFAGTVIGAIYLVMLFQLTVHFLKTGDYIAVIEPKPVFEELGQMT